MSYVLGGKTSYDVLMYVYGYYEVDIVKTGIHKGQRHHPCDLKMRSSSWFVKVDLAAIPLEFASEGPVQITPVSLQLEVAGVKGIGCIIVGRSARHLTY